jgi:hypothetical protein
LFLDQNITTRLVNSKDYRLKKGGGYHLDLAIVGVIVLAGSFFSLPWIVAATVHSLNHVKSLAETEVVERGENDKKEVIVGVRENRLSPLIIHVLMAASLFLLDYFAYIPMPVLFGLFLYMGLASLTGNQFFERIILWITDPKLYPKTTYTATVPNKWIHKFTLIQLVCFLVLWVLKASRLGILFPLMIAALVPIGVFIKRFFPPQYMDALIAEEDEQEDDRHVLD